MSELEEKTAKKKVRKSGPKRLLTPTKQPINSLSDLMRFNEVVSKTLKFSLLCRCAMTTYFFYMYWNEQREDFIGTHWTSFHSDNYLANIVKQGYIYSSSKGYYRITEKGMFHVEQFYNKNKTRINKIFS